MFTANSTMSGLVTAIYDVGCAFGAVSAFFFGERLGRKRSIVYANIIGKESFAIYQVTGTNRLLSEQLLSVP